MRIAESVLGLIREQRNEALESWVRSKDACPVWEGAEGKGPGVAPRRRPTSPHVRFRERGGPRGLSPTRLIARDSGRNGVCDWLVTAQSHGGGEDYRGGRATG